MNFFCLQLFNIARRGCFQLMKRSLFLFFALVPLLLMAKSTPEITSDKINSDGSRFINCSEIFVGRWTDRTTTHLSLSVIQFNDSAEYYLTVKVSSLVSVSINKGSVLSLRFGDGEVVQLYTGIYYSDNFGRYDRYSGYVIYTTYPAYKVDARVLKKIAKFGIRKFRIEASYDNIYRELDNDKLKEVALFLGKEYQLLQDAVQNKENDILEGF